MKKRWYDYLWIVELTYLALGFFNILFTWLGLLFFFIPPSAAQRGTATATAAGGRYSGCWAGGLACPEKRISPAG